MDLDILIFRVLTGRAGPEERARLAALRSPETDERMRVMQALLELASDADAYRGGGKPPNADELLASRLPVTGRPIDIELAHAARVRRDLRQQWTRRLLPWAAAAVLATGAVSIYIALDQRHGAFAIREIVTGSDETATALLMDGTVVRLAPSSRLLVTSDGSDRAVRLTGKGYFAVARREDAPFRIETPSGEVTVLGTRFELDSGSDEMRVTVVEGTVVVAAGGTEDRLEAGQIGRVIKGVVLPTQTVADPISRIDWTGNFLAFQSTPLRDAARDIERVYGVTVELASAELAARTVTSHFADWTLDEVVSAICMIIHAECTVDVDKGVVTMVALPAGSRPQSGAQ